MRCKIRIYAHGQRNKNDAVTVLKKDLGGSSMLYYPKFMGDLKLYSFKPCQSTLSKE